MTDFVNDNGDYLEYNGEDVLYTKQVASFRNFKIKGDLTVSFTLRNDSANRKALGYANMQQVGNHAFAPNPFRMIRNGNFVAKGFIVIEDDQGFGGNIGCYFISGNSNWFAAFDFPLNKISNDSLQVQFSNLSVYSGYGTTSTAKNYGIVFPLIDYLYYRQKYDATFLNSAPIRGQGDTQGYMELYPCLYIHTLVQELAKTSKIRISGELIDDELYNTLIMTPTGPDLIDSANGLPLLRLNNSSWNFSTGGSGPYIKIQSIPDPAIKAIDFIKWLAFSFGCVPTFDEPSQTLSLDFLDKIKKEDAEDWTPYFQSHQVKYSDLSENNYIHVKKPAEQEILGYNAINLVPYGEANIRTKKTDGTNNDLYTSPFPPVKDDVGPGPLFWATPFVQFLKLTDGKLLSYTGVTSGGSGRAKFTVDLSDSGEVGDQNAFLVFRVLDDNGTYTGYHVADGVINSGDMTSRDGTFIGNSTGKIWLQKVTAQQTGNRILSCIPSVPYNNVMKQKPGFTVGSGTDQDNVCTAYYSKPIYPYGSLNNYQKGLAYGELNFPTYNDINLTDSYWTKITAFLRNPPAYGYFILPESVFSRFNFDKFIFINHEKLTGYFFIELLEGYKDSLTPIRATMNYVDGFSSLTGYSLLGVKAGYADNPVPGAYNPVSDPDIFDPGSSGGTPAAPMITVGGLLSTSFGSTWGANFFFPVSGLLYTLGFTSVQQNHGLTLDAGDTSMTVQVSKSSNGGLGQASGAIQFYRNGVLVGLVTFSVGQNMTSTIHTYPTVVTGDTFNIIVTE